MASGWFLLAASILLSGLAETCYGVTFSSLQRTLVLSASPAPGQVLKAGEDKMTVTWSYNQTFPTGTDSTYKSVTVKLCFAPVSQVDRKWRKTVDDLAKDKTCQFKVVSGPYTPDSSSSTWIIENDVPTATYFVRAYAYDSDGVEVAYGQTTDAHKTQNLFEIKGITGRHASIDVASACFSAFSIASLVCFFYIEKRKEKMSQQK